jgi:hypothetical protein
MIISLTSSVFPFINWGQRSGEIIVTMKVRIVNTGKPSTKSPIPKQPLSPPAAAAAKNDTKEDDDFIPEPEIPDVDYHRPSAVEMLQKVVESKPLPPPPKPTGAIKDKIKQFASKTSAARASTAPFAAVKKAKEDVPVLKETNSGEAKSVSEEKADEANVLNSGTGVSSNESAEKKPDSESVVPTALHVVISEDAKDVSKVLPSESVEKKADGVNNEAPNEKPSQDSSNSVNSTPNTVENNVESINTVQSQEQSKGTGSELEISDYQKSNSLPQDSAIKAEADSPDSVPTMTSGGIEPTANMPVLSEDRKDDVILNTSANETQVQDRQLPLVSSRPSMPVPAKTSKPAKDLRFSLDSARRDAGKAFDVKIHAIDQSSDNSTAQAAEQSGNVQMSLEISTDQKKTDHLSVNVVSEDSKENRRSSSESGRQISLDTVKAIDGSARGSLLEDDSQIDRSSVGSKHLFKMESNASEAKTEGLQSVPSTIENSDSNPAESTPRKSAAKSGRPSGARISAASSLGGQSTAKPENQESKHAPSAGGDHDHDLLEEEEHLEEKENLDPEDRLQKMDDLHRRSVAFAQELASAGQDDASEDQGSVSASDMGISSCDLSESVDVHKSAPELQVLHKGSIYKNIPQEQGHLFAGPPKKGIFGFPSPSLPSPSPVGSFFVVGSVASTMMDDPSLHSYLADPDNKESDSPVEYKGLASPSTQPKSKKSEEPQMHGFMEVRRKRKFAKYKKLWKTKYFILNKDSLSYFDKKEEKKIRDSINLLGASVSTWKTYKSDKRITKNTDAEIEHSRSRSKSVSKSMSVSVQKGSTKPTEPPEDRTLVLITNDAQVIYLRCISSAERDKWMEAITMAVVRLMHKYTPQVKDLGVELKILNCGRTPDKKLSFHMEGHVGDLKWKFWRSYEELENFHQTGVLKVIFDQSAVPDLIPCPTEDSEVREFMKGIRMYIDTIIRIEAIVTCAEFLEFIGILNRKPEAHQAHYRPTISFEHVQEICQTGDIILLSNSHWISQVQKAITKADWDHVAIVIGISKSKSLKVSRKHESFYLMEATSADGVKLYPMNIRLQQFSEQCTVGFRKLDWSKARNPTALKRLSEFVKAVEGKKYSLKGLISVTGGGESGYFCSQLVTECYIRMGILPDNTRSGAYLPGDFSGASKDLPFVRGVCFEAEESLVSFKELEVAHSVKLPSVAAISPPKLKSTMQDGE